MPSPISKTGTISPPKTCNFFHPKPEEQGLRDCGNGRFSNTLVAGGLGFYLRGIPRLRVLIPLQIRRKLPRLVNQSITFSQSRACRPTSRRFSTDPGITFPGATAYYNDELITNGIAIPLPSQ